MRDTSVAYSKIPSAYDHFRADQAAFRVNPKKLLAAHGEKLADFAAKQVIHHVKAATNKLVKSASDYFKPTAMPNKKRRQKNAVVVRRKQPTRAPRALAYKNVSAKPVFRSLGIGGNITIKHEEFVANIIGSTAFSCRTFALNPGLRSTFPWLAKTAGGFERYKVKRLHLKFTPILGSDSPGRVWLAGRHDSAEAAPVLKTQLTTLPNTVAQQIWTESRWSGSKMEKMHYVRSGVQANTDVKTYDCGVLYVGTDFCASDTAVIGELSVEYEIELYNPCSPVAPCVLFSADSTTGQGGSSMFGTSGATAVGVGPYVLTADGTHIRFLTPGNYHLSFWYQGTGIDYPDFSFAEPDSVTLIVNETFAKTGTTIVVLNVGVECTEPGQILNCTSGSTTITNVRCTVCEGYAITNGQPTQAPQE